LRKTTAPVHIALLDIPRIRLIRWITDPVPDIAWKGVADDRDTPHPDDVRRIFATVGEVMARGDMRGRVDNVRLRRLEGGWTVVDGIGTVLPSSKGTPALMLIEFTVTGYSDDPDPTESGGPSPRLPE
jgi:hypothetical protein